MPRGRQAAEVIGRHVVLPVAAISSEDAGEHVGWLADVLAIEARP
jgi:hypothetical protein